MTLFGQVRSAVFFGRCRNYCSGKDGWAPPT